MIELYARRSNDTFFLKVNYLNYFLSMTSFDYAVLAQVSQNSLYISTSVCIGNLRRPLFDNTRQN